MMDSVFDSAVANVLGDAATGGSPIAKYTWRNGSRFYRMDGGLLGQTSEIECDLIDWHPPKSAQASILYVVVPCPKCGKPHIYTPQEGTLQIDPDTKALTIQAVISCNAHWTPTDEQGRAITRGGKPLQRRCNWKGVIRGGVAHHPQCPAGDFRLPHVHSNCHCGALLSPQERETLQREYVQRMGGSRL